MNTSLYTHQAMVLEEISQREVYLSILPEMESLSVEKLQNINLDVPSVVAISLGALPQLKLHREALGKLHDFDLASFDKIEAYARTLIYAHRLYLVASTPSDDYKSLQEEASNLREVLFKDASAVIARGLLPADILDDLKGANGFKNTATDLQILVGALQENWTKIAGRCGASEEELVYADKLVFRMLRVFGLRENGPKGTVEVTDLRLRAYTLLITTYDEARQALTYLRRQAGDVDRIAPSLYNARSAPKKKESAALSDALESETSLDQQSSVPPAVAFQGANHDTLSLSPLPETVLANGPYVK